MMAADIAVGLVQMMRTRGRSLATLAIVRAVAVSVTVLAGSEQR